MGYIILDPDSGAGAYKISGGANGGTLHIEHDIVVAMGLTIVSTLTAYLGFAVNYVASLAACYASEITATLLIIALLIAAGYVASTILSGGVAAPILAGAVLALLAPQQASAAQNRSCKMDCSFASDAQLKSAGIFGREESFKEDEYGARPSSRYDICACRDGAIAIFRHGQCGQTDALWEVCYETWK
jgi:hypothetical protein